MKISEMEAELRAAWCAAGNSRDPSTQLGAVVVSACGQHRIAGWNHFPAGTPESLWHDREQKYARVIHAEQHVVVRAASRGVSLYGATLFCPWACCVRCAGFIAGSGIQELVVDAEAMRRSPDRWAASIRDGHEILRANNIAIREVEMTLPKPRTLFNGEVW